MIEQETDKLIELEQKLGLCEYFVFDAAGTLVYDDPEYLKFIYLKTLKKLDPQLDQRVPLNIQSASDIYTLSADHNFTVEEFWSTFKSIRQKEDINNGYRSVNVFPDVMALRLLRKKRLAILTHAPTDLAQAYRQGIYNHTGVDIPNVNTIYNYDNPYQMLKPNRQLLDDLMKQIGGFSQDETSTNIFAKTAVIGDDLADIQLAQNVGAVPVWINRNKSDAKIPPAFLQYKNLFHLVLYTQRL